MIVDYSQSFMNERKCLFLKLKTECWYWWWRLLWYLVKSLVQPEYQLVQHNILDHFKVFGYNFPTFLCIMPSISSHKYVYILSHILYIMHWNSVITLFCMLSFSCYWWLCANMLVRHSKTLLTRTTTLFFITWVAKGAQVKYKFKIIVV